MYTRVRYTNVQGSLVSKPLMSSTRNELLTVHLHSQELCGHLMSEGGTTLSSFEETSITRLKQRAKVELAKSGVNFVSEVRQGKTEISTVAKVA